MPTRPAKPRGEAERGALAASSRPTRSAAPARTPTDNDPELAKALMDTDDHDIETQVSSAADADDDFLSPDEVLQAESTSAAGCEDKDSAEERDDETKNGQWQVAMSLRQRKRVRKQERAALDDSVARGVTESNSRGARTLAEERRGRASERDRRRTRAAPLSKNDMKIIMRPRPGLIVKELKTYEVARAIEHASGDPEACNSHKFLLRLRNGSNIIIASTPYEDVAEKILKIKTLELNGTNYPVNTYISTPAGYLKGVVHGLERETPEAELLSHLRVRTQGVTIVQARMLGQSQTAVITFDGPILPRFVYYYGGEMPCVPYQPTRQYCKLCKSQGHRTDVCPTPMTKACSNCRLRDPPEDHTCEPECALCGGGHPTAASECTKKLKRVPQRGWPPLSHKHSTPQTTGLLKRRWLSTDREDSAPPGGARSSSRSRSRSTSRSRTGSRDDSKSRNGDHKRAQAKQQQHKGKKAQNKKAKNKTLSGCERRRYRHDSSAHAPKHCSKSANGANHFQGDSSEDAEDWLENFERAGRGPSDGNPAILQPALLLTGGANAAEAGDMPLPLSADIRALNHIGRMKRTHHGQRLIFRLDSLPHSRMGQCVAAYRALVSHSPDVNDLGVPPYRHRPLTIRTNIPGAEARGGYVFALEGKNTCLLMVDVRSEAVVLSMLEVTFDSERCRTGTILLQGRTEALSWRSRLLHLALWSKRSKRGLNLKRAYFNSFAENGVVRLKFAVA
ncbi:hypothetical protein HPB52_009311 [Rhipicephalus sanguineus]|uniref:Uncharacterized protein n=1 Tax=Rhipicephalus sanguineus TaxID=34632 RepID=A0A9D4PE29_RHISA|nr:hypothetical protein HPB52_009311 [Rhipicephalus sanguineus]